MSFHPTFRDATYTRALARWVHTTFDKGQGPQRSIAGITFDLGESGFLYLGAGTAQDVEAQGIALIKLDDGRVIDVTTMEVVRSEYESQIRDHSPRIQRAVGFCGLGPDLGFVQLRVGLGDLPGAITSFVAPVPLQVVFHSPTPAVADTGIPSERLRAIDDLRRGESGRMSTRGLFRAPDGRPWIDRRSLLDARGDLTVGRDQEGGYWARTRQEFRFGEGNTAEQTAHAIVLRKLERAIGPWGLSSRVIYSASPHVADGQGLSKRG